jgi:RNA polymerase sigma-70 factor (family 1)
MMRYDSHSDEQLLSLLKSGGSEAFTELYDRYWKKLFAVAVNKIHDLYVAEELVQDILSDLWVRKETIELTGELRSYLAVAMKYRIINYQAKQKRARDYAAYAAARLSVADDSMRESLQFEELKGRLSELVAQLPERCQLTYRLSREAGLTQREIAEKLHISEKAVERNMTRAIRSLKSGLSQLFSVFIPFL